MNLSYFLLVQLTYPVYLYDKYLNDFEEHNQELKHHFTDSTFFTLDLQYLCTAQIFHQPHKASFAMSSQSQNPGN